jgi:hypothetical protein
MSSGREYESSCKAGRPLARHARFRAHEWSKTVALECWHKGDIAFGIKSSTAPRCFYIQAFASDLVACCWLHATLHNSLDLCRAAYNYSKCRLTRSFVLYQHFIVTADRTWAAAMADVLKETQKLFDQLKVGSGLVSSGTGVKWSSSVHGHPAPRQCVLRSTELKSKVEHTCCGGIAAQQYHVP